MVKPRPEHLLAVELRTLNIMFAPHSYSEEWIYNRTRESYERNGGYVVVLVVR